VRILVAGASGAVGQRLLPLLVRAGHDVFGTTRSSAKTNLIEKLGAHPVVMDALDRQAVLQAVTSTRPQVIVHQMTSLARMRNLKKFDAEFAATNRLRTEGTTHLIEASEPAGVERLVVQSFTGWPYAREGGRIKDEDDPLDPHPPEAMQRTLEAIRRLEAAVLGARTLNGIVLRYGYFYGPGTSIAPESDTGRAILRRQLPVVGTGSGVWSFIHIDDVAQATALAIAGAPSGLYNIVDDEPADVAVWLPALARAFGAKPPRHVPVWLARWLIGDAGVSLMTGVRGASNAKAKRVLSWQPRYATWRDGFTHGFDRR
jgi:nucleoside-diphosphate-sugar epimerase